MIARIGAFYFFYFALIGVFIAYTPKILQMVGYSGTQIGFLFSIPPLIRFLIPFVFLKHLKLTLNLYHISLVLTIIGGVGVFLFLNSFYLLIPSVLLMGIGMSLTLPHIETIALTLLSKERYGNVRLFGSIGFIVVILILPYYLDYPQNALYFLLGSAFLTLIFGFNINAKHESIGGVKDSERFSLKKHWALWVSLFLTQAAFAAFYNFFTNYESSVNITLETISYLWTIGVVFEIIMFRFQKPLLQFNLLHILQFTTFITAIRWFIIYLFPQNEIMLFIAQSTHALSYALYYTASIALLHTLYEDKKLAQQFSLGIAYGLGGFLGALIAGVVYEYYNQYLFLYASILTLISLIFLFLENKNINLSYTKY